MEGDFKVLGCVGEVNVKDFYDESGGYGLLFLYLMLTVYGSLSSRFVVIVRESGVCLYLVFWYYEYYKK